MPDTSTLKLDISGQDEPETNGWGSEFLSRWSVFGGGGTPRGKPAAASSLETPRQQQGEGSRRSRLPPTSRSTAGNVAPSLSIPPVSRLSVGPTTLESMKGRDDGTIATPDASTRTSASGSIPIPHRQDRASPPGGTSGIECPSDDGAWDGARDGVGPDEHGEIMSFPQLQLSATLSVDPGASEQRRQPHEGVGRHKQLQSIPTNTSGQMSSVALAAIAAGAAPVKWGRAGAAERARRAKVQKPGHCDDGIGNSGEMPPPDLGPLPRHRRFPGNAGSTAAAAALPGSNARRSSVPFSRGEAAGSGANGTHNKIEEGNREKSTMPTVADTNVKWDSEDVDSAKTLAEQTNLPPCGSPSDGRNTAGTDGEHRVRWRAEQTPISSPFPAAREPLVVRETGCRNETLCKNGAFNRHGRQDEKDDRNVGGWDNGGVWRNAEEAPHHQQQQPPVGLRLAVGGEDLEYGGSSSYSVRWQGVGNANPASYANGRHEHRVASEQDEGSVVSVAYVPHDQGCFHRRGNRSGASSGLPFLLSLKAGDGGVVAVRGGEAHGEADRINKKRLSVFVDSEQWSRTRPKGRTWGLRWPGR